MERFTEIIDLLDHELKLQNFTEKTADDIHKKMLLFKINLIQKNYDFMMFISSNLTGVYNAVFSQLDAERYFSMFNVRKKN